MKIEMLCSNSNCPRSIPGYGSGWTDESRNCPEVDCACPPWPLSDLEIRFSTLDIREPITPDKLALVFGVGREQILSWSREKILPVRFYPSGQRYYRRVDIQEVLQRMKKEGRQKLFE